MRIIQVARVLTSYLGFVSRRLAWLRWGVTSTFQNTRLRHSGHTARVCTDRPVSVKRVWHLTYLPAFVDTQLLRVGLVLKQEGVSLPSIALSTFRGLALSSPTWILPFPMQLRRHGFCSCVYSFDLLEDPLELCAWAALIFFWRKGCQSR